MMMMHHYVVFTLSIRVAKRVCSAGKKAAKKSERGAEAETEGGTLDRQTGRDEIGRAHV